MTLPLIGFSDNIKMLDCYFVVVKTEYWFSRCRECELPRVFVYEELLLFKLSLERVRAALSSVKVSCEILPYLVLQQRYVSVEQSK